MTCSIYQCTGNFSDEIIVCRGNSYFDCSVCDCVPSPLGLNICSFYQCTGNPSHPIVDCISGQYFDCTTCGCIDIVEEICPFNQCTGDPSHPIVDCIPGQYFDCSICDCVSINNTTTSTTTTTLKPCPCGEVLIPQNIYITLSNNQDIIAIPLLHNKDVLLSAGQKFKTISNMMEIENTFSISEIKIIPSQKLNIKNQIKIVITSLQNDKVIATQYIGGNSTVTILDELVLNCDSILYGLDLSDQNLLIEFDSVCDFIPEECCDQPPPAFQVQSLITNICVDCTYYCISGSECSPSFCVASSCNPSENYPTCNVNGPFSSLQQCNNFCNTITTTTTTNMNMLNPLP